jgi:hypothetical protein
MSKMPNAEVQLGMRMDPIDQLLPIALPLQSPWELLATLLAVAASHAKDAITIGAPCKAISPSHYCATILA